MAGSGERDDPFTSFNFIVDIQGVRAGFSEITGLTTETDVIEYREGNEDITVRVLPGKRKYPRIVFKRGFTKSKELWELRKSVIEGKTKRFSGTITMLDEARQPALVWRFFEAFVSKWESAGFNAKNNDIAIESMEIAHEGLELES
jgi:phage tail-like protein